MEYIRQTIVSDDLKGIINLPPTLLNKKVEVIVLSMEDGRAESKPQRKRQLGFLPGPELPDSFFEPLPEEELEAWGL